MSEYLFTVFTAAHNSTTSLPRVYDSLRSQTFSDFEWLVVDDGSTDDTGSLVAEWKEKAIFSIRYLWQENAGKHIAVNRGVAEALGQRFLILDHDDSCVPQALERFNYHWEQIPADQRELFVGVTGLTMGPDGTIYGDRFPAEIVDSNSLEMRYRYKIRGEKWGFQRTEVLRRFPYPSIPGKPYVPESIVWDQIALHYQTRYVNEALRTFYPTPNSLGDRRRAIAAPLGPQAYYYSLISLDYPIPLLSRLRAYANFIRFSCHAGIDLLTQFRDMPSPLLGMVALPVGLVVFLLDRLRWKS